MSRQSPAGLNPEFSPSEKNALLAHMASDNKFIENALVEFAHIAGHDAVDRLLEVVGGMKIHVPEKQSFWRKLQCECRYPEMARAVSNLVDNESFSLSQAVIRVGHDFKVHPEWLRKMYNGTNS